MSSETSANETDTEEYSFKVRRLKWLKRRYRRGLHELDDYSKSKLSKRSKAMTRPRITSKHSSTRPMPLDIPLWAKAKSATDSEDQVTESELLNTSLSSESVSSDA